MLYRNHVIAGVVAVSVSYQAGVSELISMRDAQVVVATFNTLSV